MDVAAVRVALAAAAKNAVPPSGPALETFSYVPADGPTPFLYVAGPESVTYDKTMKRGVDELVFSLMVWVSAADDESAGRQIDAFLNGSGASSIKAAVEAARSDTPDPNHPGAFLSLGGAADDLHVMGTDGPPRWHDWGNGKKYHGVGLRCRVIGTGA